MNTVWSAVPREEDPESRSSSPASKQSLRHSGPDTNAASATQPKRSRTGKQRQRSETRDKSGKGTPVDSSAPEEKIGVSETQLPGKSNMETPVDGWTSCRGEVIDVTRSEAESGEPVHTSQPKADNEVSYLSHAYHHALTNQWFRRVYLHYRPILDRHVDLLLNQRARIPGLRRTNASK